MNPERGRKRLSSPFDELLELLISEHEPRKGTETLVIVKTSYLLRFQNMNPERGRKLKEFARHTGIHPISEHEPRKGTET